MVIRDPGSPLIGTGIDCEVNGVFEDIVFSQNSRKQEETIKQLTIIHDRVKAVSYKAKA